VKYIITALPSCGFIVPFTKPLPSFPAVNVAINPFLYPLSHHSTCLLREGIMENKTPLFSLYFIIIICVSVVSSRF